MTAYETEWLAAMRPWWHVVARSADVGTVPVAVTLLREPLVLWRTGSGEVHAVADRCPHRGVQLSLGSVTDDGCVRCAYHGWTFDGAGDCRAVPQLGAHRTLPGARVTAAQVVDDGQFVWVRLADPDGRSASGGPPRFEELAAGTHWFWMGEPQDWDAQNLRQVENFCDVTHFSVLHTDTFGHPAGEVCEPSRVDADGRVLRFVFDVPVCDPSVPPSAERAPSPGRFEYQVTLPCTVHLGGASGPGSVMFIHSSPVDVYRTRLFWGSAFPAGVEIDGAAYAAIEEAIWAPDRRMVASQRPRGLPLDPTDELHLPHDRFALAFRRALAGLGVPSSLRPLQEYIDA